MAVNQYKTMNAATDFEQCTVIKGGACVITGNEQNCVNWAKSAADFLLVKALQNSKYKRIYVICLDQSSQDVESLLKLAGVEADVIRDRLLVFAEWESFENYWRNEIGRFQNCEKDCYYGIFLYSLSELLLTSGVESFSSSLRSLIAQCNFCAKTFDSAVQNANNDHPILLLVSTLHYTLHPVSVINYMCSMFPTSVTMKPNDGTLSQSIAAEALTIRRSLVTSKMFEHIDYFTWKTNMIHPVTKSDDNVATNKYIDSINDEDSTMEETQLKSTLQSTLVDGSVTKVNPRLITFDSTDPEFDDDDDPDQDLDL